MPCGNALSADLAGRQEKLIELQMVVAQGAWNRRSARQILTDKGPHNLLFETLLCVDEVVGNPEVFGHALDEPAIPVTARSDNAESGRGLLIVESLAKDWGSEHTGLGLLRVWASIAVFGGGGTAGTDSGTGTGI